MTDESIYINNEWVAGEGEEFTSIEPATGQPLWQGRAASAEQVSAAVRAARMAWQGWRSIPIEQRQAKIETFIEALRNKADAFGLLIAKETGKPLWEAHTEVSAMINKLTISIEAYQNRTGHQQQEMPGDITASLTHKPIGVLAVLGPFNFPGHLPNGHIIPALLAGNTVVFKASEQTPSVAEFMIKLWQQAELPPGVLNCVQGDGSTGQALCQAPGIDGILFTGSATTGQKLHQALAGQVQKILALEMGGNNPLVVTNPINIDACCYLIIQSAYITAGQRCTCARRLILIRNSENEKLLERLQELITTLRVGPYSDSPEPFMGSVISTMAATGVLAAQQQLIELGAKSIVPVQRKDSKTAMLSPGLMDVTQLSQRFDEEIFGPLLQIIWVDDLSQALDEANNTAFGLSAGIVTADKAEYQQFWQAARAGLINWNRPLTGASSRAPFGGVGLSGNFRPSAYYAADYCAYPVASLESQHLGLPEQLSPGIVL